MGVRFTAYMMIPVAVSANDRKYRAWNCQHKFGKFTHANNQHRLCQSSKQNTLVVHYVWYHKSTTLHEKSL